MQPTLAYTATAAATSGGTPMHQQSIRHVLSSFCLVLSRVCPQVESVASQVKEGIAKGTGYVDVTLTLKKGVYLSDGTIVLPPDSNATRLRNLVIKGQGSGLDRIQSQLVGIKSRDGGGFRALDITAESVTFQDIQVTNFDVGTLPGNVH